VGRSLSSQNSLEPVRPSRVSLWPGMIVSLHVASGGAAGLFAGSRVGAVLLGPPLHVAADRVPHRDIPDRRFEVMSGLVCLGLLAVRRGPFDPATLGAASSSAPDLEHLFRWLRPGGKKLFHPGLGGSGHGRGVPTGVQLLLAGAILGWLLGRSDASGWTRFTTSPGTSGRGSAGSQRG
jgi:hypothetical protein